MPFDPSETIPWSTSLFNIDQGDFLEWLERKEAEENAVVGVRADECDCPIARYLRDRDGDEVSYKVHGDIVISLRKDASSPLAYSLPTWAMLFVGIIDLSGVPVDQVRANEALSAFHEAIEEEIDLLDE